MLTEEQRKVVCFDWDYKSRDNGLLRSHVSNNWHITKPVILSDFYTKKQQDLIHDVWKGIINPDWHDKFLQAAQGRHRRRRTSASSRTSPSSASPATASSSSSSPAAT